MSPAVLTFPLTCPYPGCKTLLQPAIVTSTQGTGIRPHYSTCHPGALVPEVEDPDW